MLAGYLKCTSKFLIQARIQADFNTFYLDLALHGSLDRKQGKNSLQFCKEVDRFEYYNEVSFLAST